MTKTNGSKNDYKVVIAYLRPPHSDTTPGMSGTFEHIGIQFLKAAIQDLCDTKIIDGYAQNFRTEDVLEKIKIINPNFVGFSPTVETMNDILCVANELKKFNSNMHICLGGHHATLCAEDILVNEFCIDTIVMGGDGEETLRELIECLLNKKDYSNCLSVACRINKKIKVNKWRPPTEPFDKINIPVRDTISEISKYKWDGSARINTSRGCIYGRCTFCTVPDIFGCKWRAYSAEKALEQITQLYNKYHVKFLWFSDDQFVNSLPESVERAKTIAKGLIEKKLNLYIRLMCRADDFTRDKALIPLLYKAGWRIALVGFEAGNNRTLKTWQKGLTKQKSIEFSNILKENKIEIQAGFIMFDPTNTVDEIKENIEFLYELKKTRFLANTVRRLRMIPGTQIYRDYLKLGLVSSDFNYKSSSYDYKFADDIVGKFAWWIDDVYMRNKKYDDTFWSILNLHLPIFTEKMFEKYGENDRIVQELRKMKVDTEQYMNKLNYEFFVNALDEARTNIENLKNLNTEEYENKFIEQSNILDGKFKAIYKEYAQKINYPFLMFNFTHDGYTEVVY